MVVKENTPERLTCEIEVQANFPRPIQEKALTPSIPTQTLEPAVKEQMAQTDKPVLPPRSLRYTEEQAARMIQRIYRRLIMF